MYYDDGDDYDYEDEEGMFLPEVDIFERVEYDNGDTLERIAMEAGVIPESRKKGERFTNKVWRFYVYVNACARRLIDEGIIQNVHARDIPFMLRQIELIENPEFKNPEAFVIGYAATKSGKFNKDTMMALLERLNDAGMELKATDILRYARLWTYSTERILN